MPRPADARPRVATYEDICIGDLTDELLVRGLDVAAWREVALAAFAKVHEQHQRLTRRDHTIAALRDELRRYTAAACRPDRERAA